MNFTDLLTSADEKRIAAVKNSKELFQVASSILDRIVKKREIAMVFGPINTGGTNKDSNLRDLENAIEFVSRCSSYLVFNQLLFEKRFNFSLPSDFHDSFYKPLFEKYISFLFFLPTWSTSIGAKSKMIFAKREHIPLQLLVVE